MSGSHSVCGRGTQEEIRADVAASALDERWEQGTCHYGDFAFDA
jgi:hypothetical protein